MALAAHLVRRTAIYYWRRRLPTALGGKVILVSLRTADPALARRIGAFVTAESARAFDNLASGRMDYPDAVRHLQAIIRREHTQPLQEAPAKRTKPRSAPIPAAPKSDPYTPTIKAVGMRLLDRKRQSGISDRVIEQIGKVFDLFIETTSVRDIRQLKQTHLAQFVDTLHKLPPTYRKSPKDQNKPLKTIIAEASGPTGLSASTINRNLDYIGQLLTKARSEGFGNIASLDLTALRPRKTTRDRNDRLAFATEDV